MLATQLWLPTTSCTARQVGLMVVPPPPPLPPPRCRRLPEAMLPCFMPRMMTAASLTVHAGVCA